MTDILQALQGNDILFFDGGYGALLQSRGLPPGVSPEEYGKENPEKILGLHREYHESGARLLTTNTFGGTRFKLEPGTDVYALNKQMAGLAREVLIDKGWVGGSVGPSGQFVRPLGELSFHELKDAFKEQIQGLVDGGADFIKAETHYDLAELKAVIIACREVCDLPILASMTFEDGRSLTGTSPEVFAYTMRNMGVEIVGTNCSAGPEQMLLTAQALLPILDVPLHVQPNAGLPVLEDGKTVFKTGPTEFAELMKEFARIGAALVGGCCGTTPDHIKAMVQALKSEKRVSPEHSTDSGVVLTSRSQAVRIGPGVPTVIIGERINPTGKERLTEELQQSRFSEARRLAEEQTTAGARVLDVNIGAPMVEEKVVLPQLVEHLVSGVNVPLCLDTSDMDAAEAGLAAYPGSPLLNSISGEEGRLERLGPLCKKYGAPFILLPLIGRKLPKTATERIEIIEGLLKKADELGIPRHFIMVDGLVLTVSSRPDAAVHCMETIRYVTQELKLATTVGLSNISFGLPARELINSNFATMAVSAGLSSCIADPGSARIREALAASELLLARDHKAESFIAGFSEWKPGSGGGTIGSHGPSVGKATDTAGAVIQGVKEDILPLLEKELEQGTPAYTIIDDKLIPAITEVGDKYERKEYFLPQLIMAAETMQIAFDRLKPLLEADTDKKRERPVVIMATVEGDIHDIGKNIVILMLKNHGFDVRDLGKDVPAATIVEEAKKANASVIGLSALMTTTMVKMQETVDLVKQEGLPAKVMVGGAVVSQDYADTIGAHGYSEDAVGAVKLAKHLTDAAGTIKN